MATHVTLVHSPDLLCHAQAIITVVQQLVDTHTQSSAGPRISLTSFNEGDFALFMPLGKHRVDADGRTMYMAFNLECPR